MDPEELEQVEPSLYAQRNFTIVPNGAIAADIKPASFRVYVALRSFLRQGHATFPKVATVSARFNIPERTFAAALKDLEEAGLISVRKRSYAGGFRRVNEYYFPDIEDPQDLPLGTAKSAVPEPTKSAVPGDTFSAGPKEEEKLEEEKLEPGTLLSLPTGRKQRAGRTQAPSSITDKMREYAKGKAPDMDIGIEFENFRNYHLSKGNKMADWEAAWRTWVTNHLKFQRERGAAEPQRATWW